MSSSSKQLPCNQSEQVASRPLSQGCQVCPSAEHIQLNTSSSPWEPEAALAHSPTQSWNWSYKLEKRVGEEWYFGGGLWGFFSYFYCFTSPCHLNVSWGWSGDFFNAVENYSAFSYFFKINFWIRYLAHVLDSHFNDKSTFKHNRQISAVEGLFWWLLLVSAT